MTPEEKAARKAAREAARIAQAKLDREDAAVMRKAVKSLRAREQLRAWFPDNLDTVALAIRGDEQAVLEVVGLTEGWGDPIVALALGIVLPDGNVGMRSAVSRLWSGHRRSALEQLQTRQAQDLLRRYGTKPVACPNKITVHRGGYAHTSRGVAEGWSWTTDLLTAAFFVDYQKLFSEQEGCQPYLLRATVKTSQIVHVDDERGEEEKVIFGVKDWEVLGTPEDWAQWLAQHTAGRLAREAESMARWYAERCPTQAAA